MKWTFDLQRSHNPQIERILVYEVDMSAISFCGHDTLHSYLYMILSPVWVQLTMCQFFSKVKVHRGTHL